MDYWVFFSTSLLRTYCWKHVLTHSLPAVYMVTQTRWAPQTGSVYNCEVEFFARCTDGIAFCFPQFESRNAKFSCQLLFTVLSTGYLHSIYDTHTQCQTCTKIMAFDAKHEFTQFPRQNLPCFGANAVCMALATSFWRSLWTHERVYICF